MGSVKDESRSSGKDGSMKVEKDTVTSEEEFIILEKPQPFTRAVAESVEYRPAAVLTICDFLNKLSAKCKEDLYKLGCARHHTSNAPSKKFSMMTIPGSKRRDRQHHHKESWEKRFQRLKVYQRAFSSIVMYFKAYCPALFYIKKAYEDMLVYRINQIKQAHFEKKRLYIQKHNMRLQINSYQFPEYAQLLKCEKYLSILRQRITLQDEAIKVITEILKKMEEALSDHFERHRDLEEQIVMVDTEIANRRQKAFSMREKEEKEVKEKSANSQENENSRTIIDSDEEDKDDPFYGVDPEEIDEERRMVWIMAFAICHKDLEEAEKKYTVTVLNYLSNQLYKILRSELMSNVPFCQQNFCRLNMYQTKYQYVVPRHEHESLKRSIVDEKSAARTLVDEKSFLEDELANLKELEMKLEGELAEVKAQLTDLRTLVTPRPSWEQLGEFVQGGVPKWEKMIQGKSTRDAAEKLFTELRSRRGGEKFLQPLGTEPSILRCLRHGKKVSDRQLHSRDAALLIHDLWQARKHALEENLNAPKHEEFDFGKPDENVATKSFADFVAIYFENMYEDVEQRMEWTYNLVESCKRFSLDYRLTLFLNVLQGRADEGIYFVTRNELLRVRNTFLQKSVEEGMSNGALSSNQYVEALESTFPNKTEPEIQSIVRVTNKLNAELNPGEDADLSIYNILQLIDVRDDGFRGALVGELVKQFDQDRQVFIDKIIGELATLLDISSQSAASETDPAANRDVSVVQAYAAIKRADGDIGDEIVGAALAWIFTQTSVLPGGGITTSRLVNYAKLHSGEEQEAPTMVLIPSEDTGQADDAKFERAIKDIIREEEDGNNEGEQVSEAQKKSFYKALKSAKLRTVVKRLKGSALVPSWQIYDPKDSLLPETSIDVTKDLEALQALFKQAHEDKTDAPVSGDTSDMKRSSDNSTGSASAMTIHGGGEVTIKPEPSSIEKPPS